MDISTVIINDTTSIMDTMNVINKTGYGIALLCTNGHLEAVVTDGDIRRHILRNGDLSEPITLIANYDPLYLIKGEDIDYKRFLIDHHITAIPIVNKAKKVLTLHTLYKFAKSYPQLNTPVVIMAGGKGSRLYPYTEILPKPLIPIGEQTITEQIMDHFEEYGCYHFDMIINYKKNLIRSFFLDNDRKRDISFYEEQDFLGTGGGLKLLDGIYSDDFFMTNCDIIVNEDYSKILTYHKKEKNIITIVSAMKNVTIPYGTINISEEGEVINLKEKPKFSFMTNTGFYVIHPSFLNMIPENTFIHITDIIQMCIDSGKKVGVFPISEDAWMDMGQIHELMKMKERIEV